MRIASRLLGKRGERRAAWFYRLRGYRIVERNLRMRGGEIDLVVRRGGMLVFVEVKTRQSIAAGYGVDAVDRRKKLQIISLTSAYLARHPHDGEVRHDILSLFWTGWRFVVSHYPDAFRPISDRIRPWRWTI
ncbi:MAG TPA: YraN family protein [Thermoanaerobaculia bacterium]|jgi:putative endonuclease|nr:YraN family protein [Thermoanaerobaculia bacterium]